MGRRRVDRKFLLETPIIGVVAGLCCGMLAGQELPLGGELQVNTYTTSSQDGPSVASPGDGTFLAVWDGATVGDDLGIVGQRFDSLGSKVGGEFLVNSYTSGEQLYPHISAAKNGTFVVVWESDAHTAGASTHLPTPPFDIFGRRLDAAGAPIGPEFQVNTYTTGYQVAPDVAMDGSGNFVVVWFGGAGSTVAGQRFDSSGTRQGTEFHVGAPSVRGRPSVAMTGTGEFVVVWDANRGVGSGTGIVGQRFDSAGAKVGDAFQVDSHTSGASFDPKVAIDSRGNFVVVWTSPDESNYGVFGQRFNRSAERVGAEFPVNTSTTGGQLSSSVSIDRDGTFVVGWSSSDGSGYGAFGQRFDRFGSKLGPEFQLNTYTTSFQDSPQLVYDGKGLIGVWESATQDGDTEGIFARRQQLSPEGLSVDAGSNSGTTSDVNGVLEPGETVLVKPSWSNQSTSFNHLTGSAPLTFCIVGFPCVAPIDLSADYGTIAPGFLASCDDGSPDACFTVAASGPRPGTHWDGSFLESVSSGGSQLWTLHVGDSFSDVPRSEPFYKKIETLLHNGITSGCTTTAYCPTVPVPRDQMAIFVAKGIAGLGEYVPTAGTLNGLPYDCEAGGVSRFSDVSPTDPACRHVHYLGVQNVTLGCSPTTYCPSDAITRDAMASFIAKAIVAPQGGAGIPMTYSDPGTGRSYSCTVGSPNIHFTDVPVSNTFCRHIHFLWAKGIVDGCSATKYCPSQSVNRDAMAKFIANGFGLQLYEP